MKWGGYDCWCAFNNNCAQWNWDYGGHVFEGEWLLFLGCEFFNGFFYWRCFCYFLRYGGVEAIFTYWGVIMEIIKYKFNTKYNMILLIWVIEKWKTTKLLFWH